jgi:FKBP-type peptidyl-prolyl cis-trans isomerase
MPAMRGRLLTILIVAGLVLAGCGGSSGGPTAEPGQDANGKCPAVEGAAGQSTTTKPEVEVPSGEPPTELVCVELVNGEGAEAKAGDEVEVQYVGVNYKTGKEFDSSWSRNEPFPFTLGEGAVIKGWDQGVVGMKVGGRRQLIIPPELGYGASGSPPSIPANETLVFVVDLVKIK